MIVCESRGVSIDTALGTELGTALGTAERPASAEALRWSRFLAATNAEGPGTRAALWVQGCSVHCPGCFNPQMWAPHGAKLDDARSLAARWVSEAVAAGSTGITLLGGEPFDQAAPVAVIAEAFRAAGLSVMAFSGYTLDSLQAWSTDRPEISALLAATDLLCDGPYLREHPDTQRPWIGSTNQSIRALSDRYAERVRRIAADGEGDSIEVRIAPDGTVGINGWASDDALAYLLDDLGVRADKPLPRKRAA